MAQKSTKRILKEETTVDMTTGEVIQRNTTTVYDKEPDFVKLYLDCLGVFIKNEGLNNSLNDMLLEVLKHCSYADDGQIVHLDAYTRSQVCKVTGKSDARLKQAIKAWVDNKVFIRVGRGVYQVNPYILGRGSWQEISKLRANFDFSAGTVELEQNYDKKIEKPAAKKKRARAQKKKVKQQEEQTDLYDFIDNKRN